MRELSVAEQRGKAVVAAVIADGGGGAGLLPAHIGDDAEALGDQLDDPLVEVTEMVAEGGQRRIRFGHSRCSLRRSGP